VTRRSKRSLSAGGDCPSPSRIRRSATKASIGLRISNFGFRTWGTADFTIGSNAQCVDHFAPCSTQRVRVAICWGVSFRFRLGGGITVSGSALVTRSMSALSFGLPGTITPRSKGTFLSSNRSFALRAFASGPWHWKQ
jgi:hypothetical protein